MTSSKRVPVRTITMPPSIPVSGPLLTKSQVMDALKSEIAGSTITEVAARHGLHLSQLSDIMNGRANLSKNALRKLKLELVEMYRRIK